MKLTKEEFFKHRIEKIKKEASLYDVMTEVGIQPRYRDRSAQLHCCFSTYHTKGEDIKPSARYYPKGDRNEYETYYCWVCTSQPLDVIGFTQRVKNLSFAQALYYLERQYHIRYDDLEFIKDLSDELSDLGKKQSDSNIYLNMCENLLVNFKNVLGLELYSKFAYLLDIIYLDAKDTKKVQDRVLQWKTKIKKYLHEQI